MIKLAEVESKVDFVRGGQGKSRAKRAPIVHTQPRQKAERPSGLCKEHLEHWTVNSSAMEIAEACRDSVPSSVAVSGFWEVGLKLEHVFREDFTSMHFKSGLTYIRKGTGMDPDENQKMRFHFTPVEFEAWLAAVRRVEIEYRSWMAAIAAAASSPE